ncbi:MAG: FAD-dependent oxidoreductase [Planctomycetes bacterium]|nr:FAD-dependent oxidoreductase [Planctomycetota bacterium]
MSAEPASDRRDLVVVGGGIHGAGVLQAAAAAGLSALLLEERELAAGTSSRSSKLIHGGLRYLESGQLALVRESLRERTTLLRIAPKLVRVLPFLIPVYAQTTRRPRTIRAGLGLYALLGSLRREALFARLPASEWGQLDGLATDGLEAVFRYFDGQTDDAALTRAVVRSATSLGAEARTGARFERAERRVDGWSVRWTERGEPRRLQARVLVNAAGPWIEDVRARIDPVPPGFAVDLVAGTHLEIEGRLERGIYYVEAPRDRRAVFAIPWKGRTLLGTTETPYAGDPARVVPLQAEVDYLLETHARYFPRHSARVLASWAGNRVLPRGTGRAFDRPRETTLVVDDEARPSLVAIYGGKLTGYRATADRVVQRLLPGLPPRARLARTDELLLEPEPGFTLDA